MPVMAITARPLVAAFCAGAAIAGLELLSARLLLPAAGGGPGVFLPVLFFFALIFPIGAELSRWVGAGPRRYRGLLVIALAATVAASILGDPLRWEVDAPLSAAVLVALAAALGPALLLLSMTVPLLAPLPLGGSTAAASNAGALIGLAVGAFGEALFPLSILRIGLLLVGLAGALLVASLLRTRAIEPDRPRRIARWQGLLVPSALASAAIGATSILLTADLGGVPFLWALPLGAYFLAWTIAFAHSRPVAIIRTACDRLAPFGATLMMAAAIAPQRWPTEIAVPLLTATLFVVATSLLARIAERMPDDREGAATGWRIAGIGGAAGAAFSSLLAPVLFTEPVEIAAVGLGVLAVIVGSPRDGRRPSPALALLAISFIVIGGSAPGDRSALLAFAASTVALLLIARRYPAPSIAFGAIAALIAMSTGSGVTAEWRGRSLLGPIAVVVDRQYGPDGAVTTRALISGRTVHGSEIIDPPELSGEPTTYYNRRGPAGELVERSAGPIGVIGLGAGSMAAYASAERPIDFVDIDASVIEAARSRFGYLRSAEGPVTVTEAEGRRWIDGLPAARYGLLVVDAFNGDAIPTHLLTQEAMRSAVRVLQDGGIVAYHISNRSFSLAPAIAATARSIGLDARGTIYAQDPGISALLYSPSEWVAVGSASALERLSPRWLEITEIGSPLTDDRVDLLALLRR
jgi:hypothetical protein